jgi:triacylglycerol lipase
MIVRRVIVSLLAAVSLMGTAASAAQVRPTTDSDPSLPVIFVHGNGDDASKWVGVIWLFESNGYPANRLFSIRFSLPVARVDDTRQEPFRSSTTDAAAELSAFVTRVLIETHSSKVVLIGSSRGGLTIRNYIQNGGGSANVAAAILAGTPNHGVVATSTNPNGEFNGNGHYLQSLNHASSDGSEITSGVRFLTLRSDKLDKYAQPMGVALGSAQMPTGVGFDGPALKGATNIVLPNLDHRELAFQPSAFAQMYKFITGKKPATLSVTPEEKPVIAGVITGFAGAAPTNLPLAGVRLRIYPVDRAKRIESQTSIYDTTTREDGKWGPLEISPQDEYEFDLEYQGRHVRYYKTSLMRSSNLINLRFAPPPNIAIKDNAGTEHDPSTGMKLWVARPQGYFSRERDVVTVDGKPVDSEPSGLPIRDSFAVSLPDGKPVVVSLREETVVASPSADLSKDLPIVDFLW